MPIYDIRCPSCLSVEDTYLPHWDTPTPICQACFCPRERLVGRFAVVFTGSLSRYMDKKKEGGHMEGFWCERRLSSISGQPEPVWIDTVEELRAFNKAEGLTAPGEIPSNSTISADGKHILSDGMPGQWRAPAPVIPGGVWEMTKSLTSLTGKDPAPQEIGPPCTVEVVDAKAMESIAAQAAEIV